MSVSCDHHGSGDRAVIFLHGVGSGREGWRQQIDCVLSSGYRFVAVDAPGFGDTSPSTEPGFGPHVAAVLEVMNELQVASAVICGHSLGGMTAQELYADHPERVEAMILSATSPAFGRPDGEFQKKFLEDRFKPFDEGMTMPEFARSFAHKLVGPQPDDGAVDAIIDVMSSVSVDAYRMAMRTITGFDQRANLPNIAVPTLLIAGETDTNSPAAMMQKMAGKISGSSYVELASTGHMGPLESSAEFNRHLGAFLKQIV